MGRLLYDRFGGPLELTDPSVAIMLLEAQAVIPDVAELRVAPQKQAQARQHFFVVERVVIALFNQRVVDDEFDDAVHQAAGITVAFDGRMRVDAGVGFQVEGSSRIEYFGKERLCL